MRPPRILIAGLAFVAFVFLTFVSLRSSHSHTNAAAAAAVPRSGIQSLFSFRAPFSLFPPNAIITITNDNTTAFLARPAQYGPPLPSQGLKGQVWIGSGFGDENVRQGTVVAGSEGELGCSDVPGWMESYAKTGAATAELKKTTNSKSAKAATKSKPGKRSKEDDGPFGGDSGMSEEPSKNDDKTRPPVDDGTDDYLHHPLPESTVSKTPGKPASESKGDHADIQSLQEGAEIAGKVVLLSRGGCGFVEKTKWAQRRGAVALIVGDDQKGGALIQMYARGDTSNISIPSVFTSRTTAHLLSSLVGSGSFIEDIVDENGKPALKVPHTDKPRKSRKHGSHPTFTPTTATTRATATSRPVAKSNKKPSGQTEEVSAITTEKPNWFRSLFRSSKINAAKTESSRPPRSGQLDWILVDEWKDDDSASSKKISTKPSKKEESGKKADGEKKPSPKRKSGSKASSRDDFVIGVQDWRDPDLVGSPGSRDVDAENGKSIATTGEGKTDSAKKSDSKPSTSVTKHFGGAIQEIPEFAPPLQGGSITPGSGEYETRIAGAEKEKAEDEKQDASSTDVKSKGLLTTIFGDDEENVEFLPPGSHQVSDEESSEEDEGADEEEGLWVTITPTSGASPFLDTLLVLVVSPLVTLTVVYALLLIRSRIRRRRWRAPKSVVERLPVRTYQTIASGTQSPRTPSPTSSSVTTPLLQQSPSSRPRPRSRTTTGVPEAGDISRVNSNPLQIPTIPPKAPEHEKNASESSEWRKHMGKQVECVVCLEEYIPGVSRVMSLPCGHEFHVDCITPWLTTRRRTCPICKGDVVRSLARGSPSSPRYEPYHDDSDDDYQTQAAETINTSQTSALPIPTTINSTNGQDIEQGIMSPSPTRPRRTNLASSWRSLIVGSLSSNSRPAASQEEDRNR